MTRLKTKDIEDIASHLDGYDVDLMRITGASLRQIACEGAGVDESLIVDALDQVRFAAVPVTSGLGVIDGFTETVVAILAHLGFRAFATANRDASGALEGVARGADILMLADDEKFIALTSGGQQVAENTRATALGFVGGLDLMKGGLTGELVLVLGCGPLGIAASRALIDRSATVALCDIRRERTIAAAREISKHAPDKVGIETTPFTSFDRYELIFEASNEGSFIDAAHLTPNTRVAAPGIPCGLTPEALEEHRGRILHDVLEIGTATMAVQAAAHLMEVVDDKKAQQP